MERRGSRIKSMRVRQLLILILIACYITSYYVMDTSSSCDNNCSMDLFRRNGKGIAPVQQVNLRRSNMQGSVALDNYKHRGRTFSSSASPQTQESNATVRNSKRKRKRHLHSKLRHARIVQFTKWNETSVKRVKRQIDRFDRLKLEEQQQESLEKRTTMTAAAEWRRVLLNKHSSSIDNEVFKLSKPNLLLKTTLLSTESSTTEQERRASDNYARLRLENNSNKSLHGRSNLTAMRKLPKALIIGVKKGGTRALLEFIRLHPDVRAVGPETHFFDRHYHKGLRWYRQQMPPTLDSQLTMEKTPSYFVTKEVPRRILSMSQDIKLLVVVRDPVTRAISDYAQTVSKRHHMRSFDELAFRNNSTGLVDTTWGAIKIGVYAKHLENWLQFFPLKQFHFVSGERLIKDPAGEMAKVQDFLGVRRIVTENHFYFNETKGFPCLKKSEGNGSPRCLGKTKGRTHPNVDNSTIQHLRDFFRPFNMKFYQMTGVDFGWP